MTRRKAANFSLATAFLLCVFCFPTGALSFPWSLDMWVQPSAGPYEKPVLHPEKSLSASSEQAASREQIEDIKKSPVEGTAESVKIGEELFSYHCVSCHGSKGLGDGIIITKGHGFYPVSLVAPGVVARNDGYIYAYIIYGGKVMMPAYAENMTSRSDAWHIVNYVRHLQQPALQSVKEKGSLGEPDGENNEAD